MKIKKISIFLLCVLFLVVSIPIECFAGTPRVDSFVYVAVGHNKSIACSIEGCSDKRKSWSGKSQYFNLSTTGTVKGISEGRGIATVATEIKGEKASCTIIVSPKATISLNTNSLKLLRGQSAGINANIYPNNACKKLVWISSNENIAIVSNGSVYAKGIGNCTITCKTDDGGSGQATRKQRGGKNHG